MAISGTSTFPLSAARNWRSPVTNLAALPAIGNSSGDAIVTLDTDLIYVWSGSAWVVPFGSGSVTSVAASVPATLLTISGTPITTSGTLAFGLTSQTANVVFAGPTSGGAATPTWRALVGADLPNPSITTLGGVQAVSAVSHQWISRISITGVPSLSQPAFTDISGAATSAQLPVAAAASIGGVFSKAAVSNQFLTSISSVDGSIGQAQPSFSNISGTATAAQLPNPGASSLGGIQSFAAVANQFIRQISTSGVVTAAQPAFSNLSGSATAAQMPALTSDVTTSAGTVATTVAAIQGTTVSGTTGGGNVVFSISPTMSGTVTLSHTAAGALTFNSIGGGIKLAEGTNGRLGNDKLVAGTVTVNNTSVTAKTRIFLSPSTTGGVQGSLSYTISAATSFTINSSNVADTSNINWLLVEHT